MLKEKIVDNDEILIIFNDIGEDHRTSRDLKKHCPDEI